MNYQPIMLSPVLILDDEVAAWLNLQAAGGADAMPDTIQRMLQNYNFSQAALNEDAELDAYGLLDRKAAAAYLAAHGLLVQVIDGFTGAVTYLNERDGCPSARTYRNEPLVLLSIFPSTTSTQCVKQAIAATGVYQPFDLLDKRVSVSGIYPDV